MKIQAICPNYKFSKTAANFSSLNGSAKVVQGVSFPSQSATLFRGIYQSNSQFDAEKAVAGLFKEDGWMVGSPMHWAITTILTGKNSLNGTFFPTGGLPLQLVEYLKARHIDREVKDLLDCVSPKKYSSAEANILAKDLMDKYLTSLPKNTLEERYFNMKNPNYYSDSTQEIGFGNNAVDFIISSFNDQVASIYGNKILVMKDVRNRSLDLEYWNYVHTGSFWDGWVDNGEINTPGYVTAEELLGYQERALDRIQIGWGAQAPNNPIIYGLYPIQYKGTTYVGVFDGGGETCMLQDAKSQKVYFCQNNWGNIMRTVVPPPTIRGTEVRNQSALMGVIARCSGGGACDAPAEIFTWYGKNSKNHPPGRLMAGLNNLKIDGDGVKVIPAPTPVVVDRGTIKVVSATYAPLSAMAKSSGNVTKVAGTYVDGKKSVTYKISHVFLHVPRVDGTERFEIEWICSGKPGDKQVNSFVKAPAEDMSFEMSCED
jgi:hypothetical protein